MTKKAAPTHPEDAIKNQEFKLWRRSGVIYVKANEDGSYTVIDEDGKESVQSYDELTKEYEPAKGPIKGYYG